MTGSAKLTTNLPLSFHGSMDFTGAISKVCIGKSYRHNYHIVKVIVHRLLTMILYL